jgi:hypothetical protein
MPRRRCRGRGVKRAAVVNIVAKHLRQQYGHLASGMDRDDWRASAEHLVAIIADASAVPILELEDIPRLFPAGAGRRAIKRGGLAAETKTMEKP